MMKRWQLELLYRRCRAGWTSWAVFEQALGGLLDQWLTSRHRLETLVDLRRSADEALRSFDEAFGTAYRHLRAGEFEPALRNGISVTLALRSLEEAVAASQAIDEARKRHKDLYEVLELSPLSDLSTLRIMQRLLARGESFLSDGETLKARTVARLFVRTISTLSANNHTDHEAWGETERMLEASARALYETSLEAPALHSESLKRLRRISESGYPVLAARLAQDLIAERSLAAAPPSASDVPRERSWISSLESMTHQAREAAGRLHAMTESGDHGGADPGGEP